MQPKWSLNLFAPIRLRQRKRLGRMLRSPRILQFEETEAMYLQQVKQIKSPIFKRGYDVALGDVEIPEDSPLWARYADLFEHAPFAPPLANPILIFRLMMVFRLLAWARMRATP